MHRSTSKENDANARNREVFGAITSAINARRALGLFGAGVSNSAGYPTWGQLLDRFDYRLRRKLRNNPRAVFISGERDPLWRAEEYKRELGPAQYRSIVLKVFGSAPKLSVTELHRSLLNIPFAHVLTTNYDTLLEKLHSRLRTDSFDSFAWEDTGRVSRFIRNLGDQQAPRCYVHLHGKIEPVAKGAKRNATWNDGVVLSASDYIQRYVLSEDARKKLFTLFATQSVVFLGFSMDDPELTRILREVHAFLRSDVCQHFVVLPLRRRDDDPDLLRERFEHRYGVRSLFYPAYESHTDFAKVLRALETGDASLLPRLAGQFAVPKPEAKHLETDPEDMQKGKWGGSPRDDVKGRVVTATVKSHGGGWYGISLQLRPTNAIPIEGPVYFHLHDTFHKPKRKAQRDREGYHLEVEAYGAFTVGVECDGGQTRLELDLSQDPSFPAGFRNS